MFARLDGARLVTELLRDDDIAVGDLGNGRFDL